LEVQVAVYLSARQVGEELGIPHTEVIRRIRRGDIPAKKLGWNWIIRFDALPKVKDSEWFRRSLKRRAVKERIASSRVGH
jgi:hypothetical protein